MLRPIFKFVSALLLLSCLLSPHAALATTDPNNVPGAATCDADSMTSLRNCVNAITNQSATTSEIRITALIDCSGDPGCSINLAGTAQVSSTFTITGQPLGTATVAGLHRIANFDYAIINIAGWSNVTISNFIIHDDSPVTSISVDGSSGAVFCGAPATSGSVPGNEHFAGTHIAPTDTGVQCPVPGYVSTGNQTIGFTNSNATCFAINYQVANCSPSIDVNNSNGITISGMTIENSVGPGVVVTNLKGFYFLDNNINNAYDQGLWVSSSTDVSIEDNSFFANRGAAMNVTIASTSITQPSDVSFNTFNHNQHGDAFTCVDGLNVEGCSGGQIGITGSDFVFYGNTFLNGFDDFYDPNVFDMPYGADAFSACDFSKQCSYYFDPSLPVIGGQLTPAGELWMNGGGVETGPAYLGSQTNGRHDTSDVEITNPVSGQVIFANNFMDYGSWVISYDKYAVIPESGFVQIYNNEMFQNALGTYKHSFDHYDTGNCTGAAGCGATGNITPVILEAKPATAAEERNTCGAVNCVWLWVTEDWSPANSLALGTHPIQCALQIYGPSGSTLLTTITGNNAHCFGDGPNFVIPNTIAEFYSSVQVAYTNVATGLTSPKQVVNLVGMVPAITGAGLGCANNQCIWITATDAATGNCAVGIYTVSGALITTLTGASVNCASTGATLVIPANVLNSYAAVLVNYQNLYQGTWSSLQQVNLPAPPAGGGRGGGGGGCGTACKQQ